MHTIKSNTFIGLILYILMWTPCWLVHLYCIGDIAAMADNPTPLSITQQITYFLFLDRWALITMSLPPFILAGLFYVRPVISMKQSTRTRLNTWVRPASGATILYIVICLLVTYFAHDSRTAAALETANRDAVVPVVPLMGQWGSFIESSQALWASALCASLFAAFFAKFRKLSTSD